MEGMLIQPSAKILARITIDELMVIGSFICTSKLDFVGSLPSMVYRISAFEGEDDGSDKFKLILEVKTPPVTLNIGEERIAEETKN